MNPGALTCFRAVAAVRCFCVVVVVMGVFGARAAEARRFAVLIGNNIGRAPEVELRFAEDDADRLAQTLIAVAGFNADDVVVLRGADAAAIRRALIAANNRVRDESAADSVFFVFYSGHADAESLHVAGEALPLDELEGLTRGSPAAFRVLVLDACRSGSLTQVKGGSPAPLFALPSTTESVSGYVVLTAAAAGEDAAEADTLQASFFSHALTSGLLGAADTDDDGRVSLDEAYEYAFQQTVKASSATLSGTQHPTFHYEVRGKGTLVLSTLDAGHARRGTARLPDGLSTLVIDDDGRVVAEVDAGANHRLSLAPGRYQVRARGVRVLYEGEFTVVDGKEAVVDIADLDRVDYARLVRKGSGEAVASTAMAVGPRVTSGLTVAGAPCLGLRLAVPIDVTWFSISPSISWCQSQWSNEVVRATESQLDLALDVHRYVDVSVAGVGASVGVGAVVGLTAVRQDFATRGTAPARGALAPGVGVVVDAVVPLPGGVFVGAAGDVRTLLLQQRGQLDEAAHVETPVAIGATAFFGWRWF